MGTRKAVIYYAVCKWVARDDQLRSEERRSDLNGIEMVSNAMWNQSKEIGAVNESEENGSSREESYDMIDRGIGETEFVTYTDPFTGMPYRYNPMTQSNLIDRKKNRSKKKKIK